MDGIGVSASNSPVKFFAQVNDVEAPFKTLQAAIDAVQSHAFLAHLAGDADVQGIVYALPGVYSAATNGESMPVKMRDRVSLQGQGARGCVIRGDGAPASPTLFYFPREPNLTATPPIVPGVMSGEVLVDFTHSFRNSADLFGLAFPLPWRLTQESSEMFDGFTLQGGDVQVLFYKEPSAVQLGAAELRASISNCLFDMRHNWIAPGFDQPVFVSGPFFGIQMAKLWSKSSGGTSPGGYPDHKVLIAHNTFVFAEFGMLAGELVLDSSSDWRLSASST